jgi:hypothetical protein
MEFGWRCCAGFQFGLLAFIEGEKDFDVQTNVNEINGCFPRLCKKKRLDQSFVL